MLPTTILFALIPLKILTLVIVSRGTLSGKLKPNRLSLVLWSLPALISFCIAFTQGATLSALPLLIAACAPLFVLFLSFISHHPAWKVRHADYMSGIFSLIAIVLWLLVHNPLLAIACAIVADICAGIPTFHKAWVAPSTESPLVYMLGGIGIVLGLLTLTTWTFETAAFSIYLLCFNLFMIFLSLHKKLRIG